MLSLNGILALDIFEGSVNHERFIDFLQDHLVSLICTDGNLISKFYQYAPQLNPFPMDQSVVVMDNCSIHHDEDIRAIIEQECGEQFTSSVIM